MKKLITKWKKNKKPWTLNRSRPPALSTNEKTYHEVCKTKVHYDEYVVVGKEKEKKNNCRGLWQEILRFLSFFWQNYLYKTCVCVFAHVCCMKSTPFTCKLFLFCIYLKQNNTSKKSTFPIIKKKFTSETINATKHTTQKKNKTIMICNL